jgi:hypothetical protein
MSTILNNVAILLPSYFLISHFEEPLKLLVNIGSIDVISSQSGKVKNWDHTKKEYYGIHLYKSDIYEVNPMNYNTLLVHETLFYETITQASKEIISFINVFMGRKKPIVVVCKKEWTIITSTHPENKTLDLLLQNREPVIKYSLD